MKIFDFRLLIFDCLLAMLLLLSGCSQYQLSGKVIEGPISTVMVVDKDDPRLHDPNNGLGGVALQTTLDPQNLNRIELPDALSQWSGEFAISVEAAGAGFLEYDAELMAQLAGYSVAVGEFRLPGRSKRVLVVLAPGRDGPRKKQNVLDETMKLGEPYLNDR
ncbi:MAG: hypothetical protein IT445_01480 [Phycisphaeraceae bacterium]|nr:hypothetical protein [Phycisphaeraceae bacterium]